MKKTVAALFLFGALLGAYHYVGTIPEKGAKKIRPRPFPYVKRMDVGKLEITKEGQKVVLARIDGHWEDEKSKDETKRKIPNFRLAEPVDYKADKYAIKTFFEKLEKMAFGDVVTDKVEKHAEFEVTDEKGTRVRIWDKGSKLKGDFYIGKVQAGYTMVRSADKNDVLQAVGSLKHAFAKDPQNWRDKSIIEFDRTKVRKSRVKTPSGEQYTLVGSVSTDDPQKIVWEVESAPIKVDRFDQTVGAGIQSSLYALKAGDFADDAKAAEIGLDPPQWEITVTLDDGKSHTVHVGNQKDKTDYYVKTPDDDQIYLIRKYTADRMLHEVIDLRDKTITEYEPEELLAVQVVKGKSRLSLKRKGAGWDVSPKVKDLDPSKVKALVSQISQLSGTGFAKNPASKNTGLSKPEGYIKVTVKDKPAFTLRFGDLSDADSERFAKRDDKPDVWRVKQYQVERILKLGSDLEKDPPKPEGGKI